jgi:hypothetical protein
MKVIPWMTTLLVLNNWYLTHLSEVLAAWHQALFAVPGIERQFITAHSHILRNWKLDTLGLSILTLVLIILIWKKRLCNRWWAAAISVLWIAVFVVPFYSMS